MNWSMNKILAGLIIKIDNRCEWWVGKQYVGKRYYLAFSLVVRGRIRILWIENTKLTMTICKAIFSNRIEPMVSIAGGGGWMETWQKKLSRKIWKRWNPGISRERWSLMPVDIISGGIRTSLPDRFSEVRNGRSFLFLHWMRPSV